MKVEFRDNNFIVFLHKKFIVDIDFFNKSVLEKYFRNLFMKFKDYYNIDVSGSYEITVYVDDVYGAILYIVKEDLDYFDYYDNQVDMTIIISKHKKFLYKLKCPIDDVIFSKCDIYLYNESFYILPNDVDYVLLGSLLECSELVYGDDASEIICHGKLVRF